MTSGPPAPREILTGVIVPGTRTTCLRIHSRGQWTQTVTDIPGTKTTPKGIMTGTFKAAGSPTMVTSAVPSIETAGVRPGIETISTTTMTGIMVPADTSTVIISAVRSIGTAGDRRGIATTSAETMTGTTAASAIIADMDTTTGIMADLHSTGTAATMEGAISADMTVTQDSTEIMTRIASVHLIEIGAILTGIII